MTNDTIKDAVGLLAALGDPARTKELLDDLAAREARVADLEAREQQAKQQQDDAAAQLAQFNAQRVKLTGERDAFNSETHRWVMQTQQKQADMDAREQALTTRETAVAQAEDALHANETVLAKKTGEIRAREDKLAAGEADLSVRKKKLASLVS